MLDDPDVDAGQLIAALIEHCPDDQRESLHEALNELGEDRRAGRPARAWARDRLQRRQIGKDARARSARGRRGAADDPPEFVGMPKTGGSMVEGSSHPIERFLTEGQYRAEEGEDRRRGMAGDRIAFDSSPSGVIRLGQRIGRC